MTLTSLLSIGHLASPLHTTNNTSAPYSTWTEDDLTHTKTLGARTIFGILTVTGALTSAKEGAATAELTSERTAAPTKMIGAIMVD